MVNNRMYGNQFDGSAVSSIKEINEKLSKEQDSEEALKLRIKRFNKGLELNSFPLYRGRRGYFPY